MVTVALYFLNYANIGLNTTFSTSLFKVLDSGSYSFYYPSLSLDIDGVSFRKTWDHIFF